MTHYKIDTANELSFEQKEWLKVLLADVRCMLGDSFRIEADPIDEQEYRDKWFSHTVQEMEW